MNGLNHCDAYLKHLQAEHHRLNCALLEIRHWLEASWPTTQPDAPQDFLIGRLEGLLMELRSHFAEEEQGGCLEEALARCRSVGPNVQVLMAEHPALTTALEELIARLKCRTIDRATCRRLLEDFAARLKAHECAENSLLQFALGGAASDHDVEGNE